MTNSKSPDESAVERPTGSNIFDVHASRHPEDGRIELLERMAEAGSDEAQLAALMNRYMNGGKNRNH